MTTTINGRTPEEIKKGLARCPSDAKCCKRADVDTHFVYA
jgi:hypothetical protein